MKKLMLLAMGLTLGLAISSTTLSANTLKGDQGKEKACCKKKGDKACCKKGDASKCDHKGDAKKEDAKKSN